MHINKLSLTFMCLLSINFEYDIWNICEHVDYILNVGMCFSEIPETDSFSILAKSQ